MLTFPPVVHGPALITGGSRGIGREVALRFASLGVPVAINYQRSQQDADSLVASIRAGGGQAVALQADVSVPEEAAALIGRAEAVLGPLEVLVNNAGVTNDKLTIQMSESDWELTWKTDLAGPRILAEAAGRAMASRGRGRIVNVGSVVGAAGNAGQANYAAAKSALMGLTRALAVQCAPSGIAINCVVPGYILTDATSHLTDGQSRLWKARIPMGRYARPEEVAELIVFLSGSGASYITGQCIAIDGGFLSAIGGGLSS